MASLYNSAQRLSVMAQVPEFDRGYLALATAIVESACKEYLHWSRAVMSGARSKSKGYAAGQLLALRHFFHSEWCGILCDIDPDVLIRMLDEEAKASVYLWR